MIIDIARGASRLRTDFTFYDQDNTILVLWSMLYDHWLCVNRPRPNFMFIEQLASHLPCEKTQKKNLSILLDGSDVMQTVSETFKIHQKFHPPSNVVACWRQTFTVLEDSEFPCVVQEYSGAMFRLEKARDVVYVLSGEENTSA